MHGHNVQRDFDRAVISGTLWTALNKRTPTGLSTRQGSPLLSEQPTTVVSAITALNMHKIERTALRQIKIVRLFVLLAAG